MLVEGNPALNQSDVDAWQRLVELAFGRTLTKDESAALQEQLVTQWRDAKGAVRDQLTQAKGAWEQVSSAPGARKEVLRLALREQLLAAARRSADDPVGRLISGLYDASSPVLAEGIPPLRKGSVGALISLFEWLAQRAGGSAAPLSDVEREQFTAHLVEYYPYAAPGDWMLLSHMEETFAWLQSEWEAAGPEGQANFRANLAKALGIERTLPPAPYTGPTEAWDHPDGLFSVDYPADWSARFAGLSSGATVAGWSLLDVTLLGDAPSSALELAALPDSGALIAVATLPVDALEDRLTLDEATVALAHDLLTPFGPAEPLGRPTTGKGAVLTTWTQQSGDTQYLVWLSTVLLPKPRGAAVVTLTRGPAADKATLEPAFSRILYSLRLNDPSAKPLPDLLNFPSTHDLTLDLLNTPFPDQMDMIEGLTSGVR
ncbi:MAG: hypothetical protein FJX75_07810 [Armatimonadetes bacterium]|nr:hypothetical protein [Armatimonadota bacterium]